jgi:hypothetical protein
LYESQKYGFKGVILRKTKVMSKSGLQAELKSLKSNEAFLNEFLGTEIYSIGNEKVAENTTLEPTTVAVEKSLPVAEKPVKSYTTESDQPTSETPPVTAKLEPEPAVLPKKEEVPTRKNYDGKYVIWATETPSPAERQLIKKIIAAINIPAAQLVLETNADSELSDWSGSAFVFAFGITTITEKLHHTAAWKGTRLLKTYSLAELEANIEFKKELWKALKTSFSV